MRGADVAYTLPGLLTAECGVSGHLGGGAKRRPKSLGSRPRGMRQGTTEANIVSTEPAVHFRADGLVTQSEVGSE